MTRVAILGGGIAGLAAAYELELQRQAGERVDWQLFEASGRLGGIVETTRRSTADGEYILEGGPDGWVTEKPWARELAEELGLGTEIITSRDEDRKTYIWLDGRLVSMPDRMRMMVPEDLEALENSPLFSQEAKRAYAQELEAADALKASVPQEDESVASFVRRHFGEEVLQKIGAPLLSGVFGGDTARLSVRAVMPAFVKMEARYGSLVLALQAAARERGGRPAQATFTSLRRGMGSLIEALVARLPPERLHLGSSAAALARSPERTWRVNFAPEADAGVPECLVFDQVLLAVPVDSARQLLAPVDAEAARLVPRDASSAVLACFCWPAAAARSFNVPPGFGFLVPQGERERDRPEQARPPRLLAATFTDQKFPNRSPQGARVIRVFFGGSMADALNGSCDEAISAEAFHELSLVLPGLPAPASSLTTVRRWPRSLPQYEVGHLERMARLNERIQGLGSLRLLGNGYHGVGVPDLIRDARAAARQFIENSH